MKGRFMSFNGTQRLSLAMIGLVLLMLSACTVTHTSTTFPALPSKQELTDLKNEWTDPDTGKKTQIDITFSAMMPSQENSEKYLKSGSVPFHLTSTMTQIWDVDGKEVRKQFKRQLTGHKAQVLIYDSKGKVVLNDTVPQRSLCPT
jgi:hypothetical protein